MKHRVLGSVTKIQQNGVDVDFVEIATEMGPGRAVNYCALTGQIEVGDRVVLNSTAVELRLGTGGWHFVVHNLSRPFHRESDAGHIMKLRYTPHQVNILAAEEQPTVRMAMNEFTSLEGVPVICGMLHSVLAPALAALRLALGESARLIYIMTDASGLALGWSHLIRELVTAGLLDATITVGQAFGGDFECVSLASGLVVAKQVCGADVIIVAPGPGHAGTGTGFGFSGIAQANDLDTVAALGGTPVPAVRLSFADERPRHQGVSHHTLTILGRMVRTALTVPVPKLADDRQRDVLDQLDRDGMERHQVVVRDGWPALHVLRDMPVKVRSMGRTLDSDPEYFLAAAAAGVYAAELAAGDTAA